MHTTENVPDLLVAGGAPDGAEPCGMRLRRLARLGSNAILLTVVVLVFLLELPRIHRCYMLDGSARVRASVDLVGSAQDASTSPRHSNTRMVLM